MRLNILKVSDFYSVRFLQGLAGIETTCILHVYTGRDAHVHLIMPRPNPIHGLKYDTIELDTTIEPSTHSGLLEVICPEQSNPEGLFNEFASALYNSNIRAHIIVRAQPLVMEYDPFGDEQFMIKSPPPIESQLLKQEVKKELEFLSDSCFQVTFTIFTTCPTKEILEQQLTQTCSLLTSTYGPNVRVIVHEGNKAVKSLRKVEHGKHLTSTILTSKNLSAYFDIPTIGNLEITSNAPFVVPDPIIHGVKIGKILAPDGEEVHNACFNPESIFEHVAVWGATGTGKSTLLKQLMIKLHNETGMKLAVFDLHDEYREIATQLNGELGQDVLVINPILQKFSINPLELFSEDEIGKDMAVVERVENFISLLKQVFILGEIQETRVRRAIYSLYTNATPTIGDIVNVLSREKSDNLSSKLSKFTRGFYGELFNVEKSTLPFDKIENSTTIFELGRLPGGLRRFFVSVFLILWWDYKRRKRPSEATPHVLILDEFEHYSGLSVVGRMLSEARKYREGLICAHQGPNQIFDKRVLDNLVRNTASKFIFRLEQASDKHTASAALGGLTKEQSDYLSMLAIGEAVVKLKGSRAPFRVQVDNLPTLQPISDEEIQRRAPTTRRSQDALNEQERGFLYIVHQDSRISTVDIAKRLKVKTSRAYEIERHLKANGYMIEEQIRTGAGRPKKVLRLSDNAKTILGLENEQLPAHYGGEEHREIIMKVADVLTGNGWDVQIEEGADIRAQKAGSKLAVEVETCKGHDRRQIITNIERDSVWADRIVIVCPNRAFKQEIKNLLRGQVNRNLSVITYNEIRNYAGFSS